MTKRLADMTPTERAVNARRNERRAIRKRLKPEERQRLTAQDHLDMVCLYDLGLWSREAVSDAYNVSLRVLRDARAKYPATVIVWKGTA